MRTTTRVRNARLEVACHQLTEGRGRPLLLLHDLHGSSQDWNAEPAWAGPVFAADFTGHGESDWSAGGGYTLEGFAADADAALAEILRDEDPKHPDATGIALAGVGMGAYVALLLAGGRPSVVRSALLGGGAGLGETDGEPDFERTPVRLWKPDFPPLPGGCDPKLRLFSNEMKPGDYVRAFAERATRLRLVEDGGERPAWWHIAAEQPSAKRCGPTWSDGLAALAALV